MVKAVNRDKTAHNNKDDFGRCSGLINIKISQRPAKISIRIRKVKALPVINGKNIELATIKAIKGMSKIPIKINQRSERDKFKFIFSLYSIAVYLPSCKSTARRPAKQTGHGNNPY